MDAVLPLMVLDLNLLMKAQKTKPAIAPFCQTYTIVSAQSDVVNRFCG